MDRRSIERENGNFFAPVGVSHKYPSTQILCTNSTLTTVFEVPSRQPVAFEAETLTSKVSSALMRCSKTVITLLSTQFTFAHRCSDGQLLLQTFWVQQRPEKQRA